MTERQFLQQLRRLRARWFLQDGAIRCQQRGFVTCPICALARSCHVVYEATVRRLGMPLRLAKRIAKAADDPTMTPTRQRLVAATIAKQRASRAPAR